MRCVHEHIMALVALAAVAQPETEGLHFAQVAPANLARARQDFGRALQALEFHQADKRKLEFVRVQNVKYYHFVATKAQVLDAVEYALLVIKEIADQDDNAFAPDLARHIVQD